MLPGRRRSCFPRRCVRYVVWFHAQCTLEMKRRFQRRYNSAGYVSWNTVLIYSITNWLTNWLISFSSEDRSASFLLHHRRGYFWPHVDECFDFILKWKEETYVHILYKKVIDQLIQRSLNVFMFLNKSYILSVLYTGFFFFHFSVLLDGS